MLHGTRFQDCERPGMSLDEPFTLAATEFLRGSWDFGSVKVRGRRIEVRVDSLRL